MVNNSAIGWMTPESTRGRFTRVRLAAAMWDVPDAGRRYNTSMATGTLVSLKEFVHLPDEPGKQELSNGELVIVPPPKFIHQKLSRRLYNALHACLAATGAGEVWYETGFQLGPNTVRQPDVAVVLGHRQAPDDEWLQGSPDIVIEVLSPANFAEESS